MYTQVVTAVFWSFILFFSSHVFCRINIFTLIHFINELSYAYLPQSILGRCITIHGTLDSVIFIFMRKNRLKKFKIACPGKNFNTYHRISYRMAKQALSKAFEDSCHDSKSVFGYAI